MNDDVLFSESQKFRQWWLWLILPGVDAVFLFGFVSRISGVHLFGSKMMNNTGFLTAFILSAAVTVFMFFIRLETQIRADGIYVRFFPFQPSFRYFAWDDISRSYVRRYSPIGEFGGWGYRISISNGKAFNVSGNQGLQLVLNNNRKLLIGTNRPEQLRAVLEKMGHYSS